VDLLNSVHEIVHVLGSLDPAVVLEEQRVDSPLSCVRFPGEVLVSGGHLDALFESLLLEEGQQGVEMVPVVAL
jgi:hypothetical protein